MKTIKIINILILTVSMLMLSGCDKDTGNQNGTLVFKMINPIANLYKSASLTKADLRNTALTGDITEVITVSLKACVGDVWVSTGTVAHGQPNNLEWIKITSVTNNERKLFEDYMTFSTTYIPAGVYKSIKVTLKNHFYRYAVLKSNHAVKYEFLETMGSYLDPSYCNDTDESWASTNYFGPGGNHIDENGIFKLVSAGEKLGGFTIEKGATVTLSWRMGGGTTDVCTTLITDVNHNRRWDCGVDTMDFDCPPTVTVMWDFVVEY